MTVQPRRCSTTRWIRNRMPCQVPSSRACLPEAQRWWACSGFDGVTTISPGTRVESAAAAIVPVKSAVQKVNAAKNCAPLNRSPPPGQQWPTRVTLVTASVRMQIGVHMSGHVGRPGAGGCGRSLHRAGADNRRTTAARPKNRSERPLGEGVGDAFTNRTSSRADSSIARSRVYNDLEST